MEPGDTPRYGAGANIENHPQVTSFVPRRFRTLSLIALGGIAIGVVAELVAHYSGTLSELIKVVTATEIIDVFSNRLVAWTSAMLLLLTAAYRRLVLSLRRHRVDDLRGRYRVWRTASWAMVILSLNTVLAAHTLVARYLGDLVAWQLLPAHVGWWLVPAALVGGWIGFKLIADTRECRGALVSYLLAAACLTAAGIYSAGWSPLWAADWPELLSRSLPLGGYTFILVGSLLYARYVVLDVQGLIEHKSASAAAAGHADKAPIKIATPLEQETAAEESDTSWVDGTEPEIDDQQHANRRLSKAERKRLRKQKNRNRAA
ncbi:MAG: hypothetical protein ACR2NM_01390 [Bythopirellula sp.]